MTTWGTRVGLRPVGATALLLLLLLLLVLLLLVPVLWRDDVLKTMLDSSSRGVFLLRLPERHVS